MAVDGLTFASIEQFTGRELGISDWFTIDQHHIDTFADVTHDHQWIHVDAERAAASPLGTTIAHGFLTLSLLSHFQFQVGVFPVDVTTVLNYGLDRVRFLTPVKAGQRVRARLTITSVDTRPDGSKLVKMENTVEIDGVAKPALVAETLTLLLP